MFKILLSLLILTPFFSNGQLAKATYTMKVSMNMDFANNPNIPKNVAERIKKRMSEPQSFNLFFDQTQSLYKKEEKLDNPQGGRGGGFMRFGGGDGSITHTDLAARKQTSQQELFGKTFLVSKNTNQRKWAFTGESKQIGQYTAYEATYVYKKDPTSFTMSFGNRNKKEEEEKEAPEKVAVTVSVWFTPDIPISAGPASYFGLPGLVLMVQDDNRVLVCTEVQMNVKDKIKIEAPKKGRAVTQKEFSKIREQKAKEMRDRFQNNGNRGNGNRIMIKG
jgi:GLPGLI family protein